MASTSETGHAKNIANFQRLITFVDGYGADYNPSKARLKISELNILLSEGETKLTEVLTKNVNFNNAVNNRMVEFSTLRPLATRVVNALQATDAGKETIKDALTFNRKLQGKRATQLPEPIDPNTPAPKTISTSQQSYDQQIQHFAGIIAILEAEPTYIPNETDLIIANLAAKQTELTAKNKAVDTAYTSVSNARISRDKTLYTSETGMQKTAQEIKKYVKSVFGGDSPQYDQVKGIEIRNVGN